MIKFKVDSSFFRQDMHTDVVVLFKESVDGLGGVLPEKVEELLVRERLIDLGQVGVDVDDVLKRQ